MRRHSIWLIIGVMLLAFLGLLYMQVGYIRAVYQSRGIQFDEVVRQSLYDTNGDLERAEMSILINEMLGIPAPIVQDLLKENSKRSTQQFPNITDDSFLTPEGNKKNDVTGRQKDRIMDISRSLQDKINDRYKNIREMVLELALNLVRNEVRPPLYERMTSAQLENSLNEHFQQMGVTIPYVYEVVDSNNRVYFSTGTVPVSDDSNEVYSQVLFSNDNPSNYHYLRLYFPGKKEFISSSIDFLIPSSIFTVLLFITFAYSIFNLFRQKKIDEIRKDFINNMTHELKTPVSSILIGTSLLYDSDLNQNEEQRQKTLSSITAEGNRLNLLIEKVLQMSFFDDDNNHHSLNMKMIDVEELIISVTSIFGLKVENINGQIDLDINATLTQVMGDEMHLTNIIFNLLDNAIKYRRADTPLKIGIYTCNDTKGMLVIRISDNGQGIKKEYLKKIFDRFFRVPTGNRHNVKGFGLGLSYVSRMVKSHSGTITADSKLGEGTTFEIKLPTIQY